jgi:hypothetical protein
VENFGRKVQPHPSNLFPPALYVTPRIFRETRRSRQKKREYFFPRLVAPKLIAKAEAPNPPRRANSASMSRSDPCSRPGENGVVARWRNVQSRLRQSGMNASDHSQPDEQSVECASHENYRFSFHVPRHIQWNFLINTQL